MSCEDTKRSPNRGGSSFFTPADREMGLRPNSEGTSVDSRQGLPIPALPVMKLWRFDGTKAEPLVAVGEWSSNRGSMMVVHTGEIVDLSKGKTIRKRSPQSWEPYVADDVHVQFYMMSPYMLKTLSTDKKGMFHTSSTVPDVFQFKVEYEKLGYTTLSLSKQIPVRPYRHNEYETFIPTAYPYYRACFSTMAGFFVFSFVYLYHN
ncbi:dolichyl-diphosphooligosaccharide--protein glycosyltransferase 48 kDa subunit-like [Raphanus sativus]|uniref:Dolichyl-diphosphooligosaccharide--protein glycosyltransferase 48 kDa subunit-like n=1 Tax=Raphanus sativus TaxID=3726 RepID=A0A9W3BUF3_RAPSA|nr:dolichyl-diphosphooligosaccharide--protein glycosyltransferase 48 kDa subunit-like [Raphanus sativus]